MGRQCPYTNGEISYTFCRECESHICDNAFFCWIITGTGLHREDFDMGEVTEKIKRLLINQEEVVIVTTSDCAFLIGEHYALQNHCTHIALKPGCSYEEGEVFISSQKKHGCVIIHGEKEKIPLVSIQSKHIIIKERDE